MRKALVIIAAIALLGVMATFVKPAEGNDSTTLVTDIANQITDSKASGATSGISGGSHLDTGSSDLSVGATNAKSTATLADGTFRGADVRNRYGDVQISVTIASGKITAITFDQLDANDRHSEQINGYASSRLISQTINTQSASIAGVSGATYTTDSYIQSLQSALDKAKV